VRLFMSCLVLSHVLRDYFVIISVCAYFDFSYRTFPPGVSSIYFTLVKLV